MKTIENQSQTFIITNKIVIIFLTTTFTSIILLFYWYLLQDLLPISNLVREFFICLGQLIFQGSLLLIFKRKIESILDYLYEMMLVSFIGALLLLPVLISHLMLHPFSPGIYYYLAYFFVIVIVMFVNHKKRVQSINAPRWLIYTWVVYRLIVLAIIL